jgi:hypothetical protein
MPRRNAACRVKSHPAANCYACQYSFYEANLGSLDNGPVGEFIYALSADRKTTFALRILVQQSALEAWAQANGCPFTSGEEYAVAKMRLFRASDEGDVPLAAADVSLFVNENNLGNLPGQLNI